MNMFELILGPLMNIVGMVVDRLVPDRAAAEKAKIEIQAALIDAQIKGQLGQLEVNKIEAASPNVFVAGWRPFIGWCGGAGFAVQFVIVPLTGYISALLGHQAPPPISLDPILWEVVFGILGINIGARTFEKYKGVS
jgi:tetrahydromethanopterin S-methyltransferase subunit E